MPSTRGRRGITVVIPFRGESYLRRLRNCLRSLTRQMLPPTEIIVSEQDDAGAAQEICEEVGATHLVTAARPMFNKSAAINSGIQHSTTYHVYVLDADVILSPFALEEIWPRVNAGAFVMLDARRASVPRHADWSYADKVAWAAPWSRTCTGLLNATTRKTWFQLRGYDERFVGWGSEDSYVAWKVETLFRMRTGWVAGVGVHQEHGGEEAYRARGDANKALMEKLKKAKLPASWGQSKALSCTRRVPVKDVDDSAWKFCVLVTTYNRPEMLLDLLHDIAREADGLPVRVVVFDDGSTEDYSAAVSFMGARGWEYRKVENHGKEKYWDLTGKLFAAAKEAGAKYYLQLPDDVRLCEDFFDVILRYWRAIPDDKKIALNPLRDALRLNVGCWSGITPKSGLQVDQVGWVDMCYLAEREFFELLDWRMLPIHNRPLHLGSGVGQQITARLLEAGRSFYRAGRSLVVHVVAESRMNKMTRLQESMRVDNFIDGPEKARELEIRGGVAASVASIPSRERLLEKTVASLLPQVTQLNVYLNGYDVVPPFLHDEKIAVAQSQHYGDLGDAGKFWWCEEVSGFHLTCDDDLIYPADYVDKMLLYLEFYGRRAAISAHGSRLLDPIKSYYASRQVFACLGSVAQEEAVHVLGTGAMAYHTSTIKLTRDMFKLPNMADVWVALAGQEQKVPFVCVPHEKGWIQYMRPPTTIYSAHKNVDAEQTRLVQQRGWRVHEVRK